MKDRIRAKMEAHVESILGKPIINDQEYMLIAGYLSKLEFEEQAEESKRSAEENQERMKKMMSER